MNRLLIPLLWLCGGLLTGQAHAQGIPGLIPLPVSVQPLNQQGFQLQASSKLCADKALAPALAVWREQLSVPTGFALPTTRKARKGAICLRHNPALPAEGYRLHTYPDSLHIEASTPAGAFWALQTLRQLLPAGIYASRPQQQRAWTVPAVSIEDHPRFAWRGMMLDVSRQFFDVPFLKRYLDWMAAHKLNVFHWHLTDDNGWRMEIKKYPFLTEKGAWRGPGEVLEPSFGSGNQRYGGFYTQQQVQEIVAYAARLHIEVIPEIDIPGHCRAVTASYPETACNTTVYTRSVQGELQNVWCAGREENFHMLEDILKEVAALFPSPYLHIGGDEVNKQYWKHCPRCQTLAKDKGFEHLDQTQHYFVRRIEGMVEALGKRMVGWGEIMEGGNLSPNTTVMAWMRPTDGVHAARKGQPVVMLPAQHCYFDMAHATGERGHWWAGLVNTETVYAFNPVLPQEQLSEQERSLLFGVQAALWTEYVDRPARQAEFQTYPRLSALAEVGWTPQQQRAWPDFEQRLSLHHYARLQAMGINFRLPPPQPVYEQGKVLLPSLPFPGATVRYTTDGSEPTAASAAYEAPFAAAAPQQVRMRSFLDTTASLSKVPTWGKAAIWETSQAGAFRTELNVDATIGQSGNWEGRLQLEEGKASTLTRVSLLADGVVVASAKLEASTDKPHRFRLPLDAYAPQSTYSLRIEGNHPDGTPSRCALYLEYSPLQQPAVRVSSSLQAAKSSSLDALKDYDPETRFTSLGKAKKGDYVLFEFDRPISFTELEVSTGLPTTSRYLLNDAVVQIATDGETFVHIGTLHYGRTTLKAAAGITALRLLLTADQHDEKVVVEDLRIR